MVALQSLAVAGYQTACTNGRTLLLSCHFIRAKALTCMQFGILPLHYSAVTTELLFAVLEPACMNARCCHAAVAEFQTGKYNMISLYHFFDDIYIYTCESLQSFLGYTSCFVVAVVVVVIVACLLLILYSIKQFENLTLQQGSHVRMQFGILPLQQGNSLPLAKLRRYISCFVVVVVVAVAVAVAVACLLVL
jgi:hypothetical protein